MPHVPDVARGVVQVTQTYMEKAKLLVAILESNAKWNQGITNQVMNDYDRRINELERELEAVRRGVEDLLDGLYMSNPRAVRSALHPSRWEIQELLGEEGIE